MTTVKLADVIAALCEESGLSVSDRVAVLRKVLTRVQMNVSPGTQKPKKVPFAGPLLRPSGKLMGKQKSQPKEKD